jgi:hypothetical protein
MKSGARFLRIRVISATARALLPTCSMTEKLVTASAQASAGGSSSDETISHRTGA